MSSASWMGLSVAAMVVPSQRLMSSSSTPSHHLHQSPPFQETNSYPQHQHHHQHQQHQQQLQQQQQQHQQQSGYIWFMIRSIKQHEPELVRLCRARSWLEAGLRSQSHPQEAVPGDACLRGDGDTSLSLAIRGGAPRHLLHSLLLANIHQMGIVHRFRGTILHDALKHRVSDEVLGYLLQRTIQYQQEMSQHPASAHGDLNVLATPSQPVTLGAGAATTTTARWPPRHRPAPHQFLHVSVQDRRLLGGPHLLGVQDDLGRTALHYLVEHAKVVSEISELRRGSSWLFFRTLLEAYPLAAEQMDSDGNTPLMMLLITPRGRSIPVESDIHRMIELILHISPASVMISRKMPRPWRFHSSSQVQASEAASTPLYHAVLNGRSMETIKLLLNANHSAGVNGSSTVVSPHHEVCLHIAVTTRAPLSTLQQILCDNPQAALTSDIYGLTALDWLWIRHVLDWHANPMDFISSRMISRRRFIPNQFLEWHEFASENIPLRDDPFIPINTVAVRRLQADLLQRLKVLLPATAAATTSANINCVQNGEPWTLLHAVCCVHCPIGLLRVVLLMDRHSSKALRTRDLRMGRFPLHYAAGRVGFEATLPIGVSRGIQRLQEDPPLADVLNMFPEACQASDLQGQLPLHVAIDAAKRYRVSSEELVGESFESSHCSALGMLVARFPAALEYRDGQTKLYPWQQAAIGQGASVDTIYFLLRRQPILVYSTT